MTRSAEVDLAFHDPVEISSVLQRLSAQGVSFHRGGEMSYVLDEDDMFEWVRTSSSELDRVVEAADNVNSMRATFVITVYFTEEGHGGEIMFHKNRKEVSFMATVNRRYISGSRKFCDFGWYLERLVPALEPLGLSEVTARDYK